MGIGKTLCKWFGHAWNDNPKEWGRKDCKRCRLSHVYFYSKERGAYFVEIAHGQSV